MHNYKNKIPIRTCVVCRMTEMKCNLIRLVSINNKIVVDESGKLNGRGAYVHASESCFTPLMDGTKLKNALRIEIDTKDLVAVKDYFEQIMSTVEVNSG